MQVTWAEMHGNSSMIQLTQFNCYLRMCYAQVRAFQVAILLKNLPANAGDTRDSGSISGSGRSPGVQNGNPLQYSCLGNTMDGGAWWATVHGAAESQTQVSN